MKRWLQYGLAIVIAVLFLAPSQALAYSYGDANTEEVAETFKIVEAALNGTTPDWKTAEEAYKVRRSEIKSHFGDAVAVTLDNNFQEKDAKLAVANFKAVLVMNLDRRFKYALKDVNDYAQAKLLLAKAKATYDTLSPYMNSGASEINQAFEEALEALGNPGLFGVGKKEVQPEVFEDKVNFIYNKVKPLFPYKAYVKPASSEETPPSKEPAPSKEGTGTNNEPAKQPDSSKEPVAVAGNSPEPSASESGAASESPSAEPTGQLESSEASATSTVEAAPSEPQPDSAAASASVEVSSDQASEEASADHAPMDRADKTNSWVTVMAIGGVVLIGGGAVWFARKKGLF